MSFSIVKLDLKSEFDILNDYLLINTNLTRLSN